MQESKPFPRMMNRDLHFKRSNRNCRGPKAGSKSEMKFTRKRCITSCRQDHPIYAATCLRDPALICMNLDSFNLCINRDYRIDNLVKIKWHSFTVEMAFALKQQNQFGWFRTFVIGREWLKYSMNVQKAMSIELGGEFRS